MVDVLLNDIRYAVRGFSRGGVFTAITTLTLGLGIGVVTALFAVVTRSLRSLLFEVQPVDPDTFLMGAAVLIAVVLLAAYFPARRAASADPAAGLRPE